MAKIRGNKNTKNTSRMCKTVIYYIKFKVVEQILVAASINIEYRK